jgi:N-acetylglucosamine kinase-like BadF-type ATPase
MHLSVGIDVGATKTSLRAHPSGPPSPVALTGPAANPKRVGRERTTEVLADLIRDVLDQCPTVHALTLCVGVAGADRRDEQSALARALAGALDEEGITLRVDVVHDTVIALETAFGAESGLVVIAGTGSVAVGRTRSGALERVGGWGHLLGDPGSGHAIGRSGLRAVAEALEGGTDTALRTRVGNRFGLVDRDDLLQTVYSEEFRIQDVAPMVAEAAAAEDDVAERILGRHTNRLVRQVEWLIDRAPLVAPRAALLGGMLRNEYYARTLRRALRVSLPEWTVEVVEEDPVSGALRRARRLTADA